ncbi:hypothetical protein [Enterobacter sp. RHBSTW-00175]|jgi:hypothetical protein|uniref:hypothetical protein n=1 Tax=Enterobacter sp. RHBSTW-00175 TaxID=2742639 RepID=UPI0015EA4709|nr:hypothetical protein [Enterobacter sp. RHBSTW-00175]QMR74318.1 hypothetical protein HV107_01190 [Enterobacter sp. RHBSTW-00175]
MKNFLNSHPNIGLLLIAISAIGMLFILIVSAVNKLAYKKIIKLYIGKYSRLPLTAALAKEASLVATPGAYHAKVGFIMGSLMLPYNKITNHDMTREQYDYINNLPLKLTIGFRVEAFLWVVIGTGMVFGFILEFVFN